MLPELPEPEFPEKIRPSSMVTFPPAVIVIFPVSPMVSGSAVLRMPAERRPSMRPPIVTSPLTSMVISPPFPRVPEDGPA